LGHLFQLTFLGKDVLAKARTGTGKTVAFLVSLLICVCQSELVVNCLFVIGMFLHIPLWVTINVRNI